MVIAGKDPHFPVISRQGKLIGVISLNDVKDHLFDKDVLQNILIADDIAVKEFDTVTPDDNCQTVLDKLGAVNLEGLPVVDPRRPGMLKGMIWRRDVLKAYNKEIERRDITSAFASQITMKNIDQSVHFMEGYAITEIPVPNWFVGKSIRDINVRARFGIDILLIRANTEEGSKIKAIPDPDYVFSFKDSLVIAGEIGKLNLFKSRS